MFEKIIFLKISFMNFKKIDLNFLIKKGGLFLFPSGPGLASFKLNSPYHKSLINADHVFFDSGYFVLLLRFLKNIKVYKFSAYKFIKILFKYFKNNNVKNIFSVDPSKVLSSSYRNYLRNYLDIKSDHYIAPIYNPHYIVDTALLQKIETLKPRFIIINLGGNIQEPLGYYLKKNLKYNPSIFCTGAAIAFFTKDQASINSFYDKIYVGWLIRILFNPKIFLPRYLMSIKLFFLVLKNQVFIK